MIIVENSFWLLNHFINHYHLFLHLSLKTTGWLSPALDCGFLYAIKNTASPPSTEKEEEKEENSIHNI